MQDTIESIRRNHPDCMTRSCRENQCRLQLDDVSSASLAIIHGTKYQRNYRFTEKLCDRIVFCEEYGFVLAAVELESGGTIHLSDAITQIQNGLRVAGDILGNRPVAQWFPLLLYNGSMKPNEPRLLRTKSVKFRDEPKNVEKRGCGTRFSEILSN
jgi:hypothetical protein